MAEGLLQVVCHVNMHQVTTKSGMTGPKFTIQCTVSCEWFTILGVLSCPGVTHKPLPVCFVQVMRQSGTSGPKWATQ
jgi:hypothetical protein